MIGSIVWVAENVYLNVLMCKMFNASAGDSSLMVGGAVAVTPIAVFVTALIKSAVLAVVLMLLTKNYSKKEAKK